MIEHLPEMIDAGVCSLKIEGRMKSIHYLAGVLKVYREAIDAWYGAPEAYRVKGRWLAELSAISHRGYCTGFYFGDPDQTAANLDDIIQPGYRYVAKVIEKKPDGGARVLVKNKIVSGDAVDILTPGAPTREDTIQRIVDGHGVTQSLAQPGSTVTLYLHQAPQALDLIRHREIHAPGVTP